MMDSATFSTSEASDEDLGDLLLEVPGDGSTMGNQAGREALGYAPKHEINKKEF